MTAALEEFKMTMDEIQSHWMRSKNEENWTPTLQYLNGASGVLCHLPHRSGLDYYDALDDIYLLRRVIHNRCKLRRETEEAAKVILFSVDAFVSTTDGQAQHRSCHQLNIKCRWHEKHGTSFTFNSIEYKTLEDLLSKNRALVEKAKSIDWSIPSEPPQRTVKEQLEAIGLDCGRDFDFEWPSSDEQLTFFQIIRRWRIKNHVSLREMAEKLGMGSADLSAYEAGKKAIDKSLILNVRASYPELDNAELTSAYIYTYKTQKRQEHL